MLFRALPDVIREGKVEAQFEVILSRMQDASNMTSECLLIISFMIYDFDRSGKAKVSCFIIENGTVT